MQNGIAPDNILIRISLLADPSITQKCILLDQIGIQLCWIVEAVLESALWQSYNNCHQDNIRASLEHQMGPYLHDVLEEHCAEHDVSMESTFYWDAYEAVIALGELIYPICKHILDREIFPLISEHLDSIIAEPIMNNDPCDYKIILQYTEAFDAQRQRDIRMSAANRARRSNLSSSIGGMQQIRFIGVIGEGSNLNNGFVPVPIRLQTTD